MPLALTTRLPGLLLPYGHSNCARLGHARRCPTANATPSLRRLAHSISGCCQSRVSTSDGETTGPLFSTSASAFRRLPCGAGSDTPFPPPFLAGTAGWRHLLRPGGTAPLCFPAKRDSPGFRSPQEKIGHHLLWPQSESFFGSQKKRSLAWGARTTCLKVPREKAGRKRRKKSCIKTAFPLSASSATTHN